MEIAALASLSWQQRMMAFVGCCVVGGIMMFMALSFLPMVFLGMPTKFALSYALANFALLGASCFLVGPTKQLQQMCSPGRALPSCAYGGSLVLLMYVIWASGSFSWWCPCWRSSCRRFCGTCPRICPWPGDDGTYLLVDRSADPQQTHFQLTTQARINICAVWLHARAPHHIVPAARKLSHEFKSFQHVLNVDQRVAIAELQH